MLICVLIMCFLVKWIICVCIVKQVVIIDHVCVFIPCIKSVFVRVSQILFIIIIIPVFSFDIGVSGNTVVYRMPVLV